MEPGSELGDAINAVLSEWPTAISKREYQAADPVWRPLEALRERIGDLDVVTETSTLSVKRSSGGGGWPDVPWVAVLDSRETSSVQRGVFVVFLFRKDGSGVYLCLAQGVSEVKGVGAAGSKKAALKANAEKLRHQLTLPQGPVEVIPIPDLRGNSTLAKDYEVGAIGWTFYETNNLPDDEAITKDLELLLGLYREYVEDKEEEIEITTTGYESLSKELLLPAEWLEEIDGLLREKRQVIFQGPPGTGKTYVAKALAKHLCGDEDRVRIVQFHPSYSYEDFVQGFRPVSIDGTAGFQLVDGPLLEMAGKAADDPDNTYILIIDEINRSNVAKVFGELYFLLEYRREGVQLQYGASSESKHTFKLPDNLWFIGTMNTADQSIALLDSALRRRFYFVDFYPTEEPIRDLLELWLKDRELWEEYSWLTTAIDNANKEINNREISLGPSYFLSDKPPLSKERIDSIWEHAVFPYLEEQFFGDEKQRKRFSLEELLK